jgi:SAM-dependent methyltransferase
MSGAWCFDTTGGISTLVYDDGGQQPIAEHTMSCPPQVAKPQRAVVAIYRILKPGGRIAILDLLKHQFGDAREPYTNL